MASLVYKRIYVFIALVLTVGILTPSLVKLHHAFNGHSLEKQCIAQGTDHIHSSDIGCEFHDFTLVSKLLISTAFTYELVVIQEIGHYETYYSFIFKPFKTNFQTLRGPPSVSLSLAV